MQGGWREEVGTTDDGQKICTFYVREQRVDRGCAIMDKVGRINNEEGKKKEGAEANVVGKRPSDGNGEGAEEKRQRNW